MVLAFLLSLSLFVFLYPRSDLGVPGEAGGLGQLLGSPISEPRGLVVASSEEASSCDN